MEGPRGKGVQGLGGLPGSLPDVALLCVSLTRPLPFVMVMRQGTIAFSPIRLCTLSQSSHTTLLTRTDIPS